MNLRFAQRGETVNRICRDRLSSSGRKRRIHFSPGTSQSASALLVVIVLMAVLATLAVSNSLVLRHLKRELNLIERKQIERLIPSLPGAPAGPTNRLHRAHYPKR